MIHLNPNDPKIIKARDEHYKVLRYIILRKLKGKDFKETKPNLKIGNIQKANSIDSKVSQYLLKGNNLENVLVGNPLELDKIKDIFKSREEISSIKALFNYDAWRNKDEAEKSTHRAYNAYNLAENLKIQTCVYCNRMYTKTVVNPKKITRPEFDHWFPIGEFPLLALSFYNLIPSCHICNSSIKGSGTMKLETHFHPYVDNEELMNQEMKFSYYYFKKLDKYVFKVITTSSKAKNTADFFKLNEIYKTHVDEIEDLRKIKDAYSDRYLDILASQYKGLSTSPDEVYRLAFGTEIEETKFSNRPLSKMKKDILIELGIIKKIVK